MRHGIEKQGDVKDENTRLCKEPLGKGERPILITFEERKDRSVFEIKVQDADKSDD
jgi:hypothetical protein